jgi:uncharacterized membrane protein
MIPKSRLDALTDGVFAVAMTLLVIDLRLPETFQSQSTADLLHRIVELGNQLLVYAISFYVLALRWTGMVKLAPRGEEVSEASRNGRCCISCSSRWCRSRRC